jgi:hypothetical protein
MKKLKKRFMPFKIKTIFNKDRPLSWSAISSFSYSPEQWFNSYYLKKKQSSPEMTFGSYVDKRFQTDAKFIPDVERFPRLQHGMKASLGLVPLIGYTDGYDFGDKKRIMDLKTGKRPWDQKRADETGQLTMYALLLFLTEGVNPEDVEFSIVWLPTSDQGNFSIGFRDNPVVPVRFVTKRTLVDILQFGRSLKKTMKEMEEYTQQRLDNDPLLAV